MPSALFICTGNQFRSPVAEETFRQLSKEDGREDWIVSSAGTWAVPGQPPLRVTVEWARSLGLDLSRHITRLVDASMLEQADIVLVMEAGHKEAIEAEFPAARQKTHLLSYVLTGKSCDISDPATAMEEMDLILRGLVTMIRNEGSKIYQLEEKS